MNRRERRQASHRASIKSFILSAQGGATMLHQVAKPSLWRGGASLFLTPEKDAAEGNRTGVKFNGWREHWQEVKNIRNSKDHWRVKSQGSRRGLQRPLRWWRRQELRRVIRSGVRVSADPSDRCCERILTFIKKLEMYRTWPTNAGTRFSSLS